MPAGDFVSQRQNRFVVKYDENTHVWRVVDSQHSSLKGLDLEAEISDVHPSMTLITEGAYIEIMREAEKLGLLQSMLPNTKSSEDLTPQLEAANLRITELTKQLEVSKLKEDSGSESYKLKRLIIDKLSNLATSESIMEVTK